MSSRANKKAAPRSCLFRKRRPEPKVGKRAQDEKGGFADVDKMGKDLRWCGNEIKHSSIHLLCERRKFTAIATRPATGKWHLAWKDFFVCC